MAKTCPLSAIAFSPCTSSRIIQFCEANQDQQKKWFYNNIKTGVETINMHRNIFYLSMVVATISPLASDKVTVIALAFTSVALMAYSAMSIYQQATRIQSALEPYLKVSCCGADALLNPPQSSALAPREADYGAVGHEKKPDTTSQTQALENV